MSARRHALAGAVVLLVACGEGPPAEAGPTQAAPAADRPIDQRPGGRVADGPWEAIVAPGGELRVSGRTLAHGVDPRMALRGDTLVWAQEGPLRETELWWVRLPDGTPARLTSGPGSADRPALSPEGDRVAYVSSRTGLAAWWVHDLTTGTDTQLTNTDLGPRRPTGPPEGWLPVPDGRDYAWDTTGLRWVAGGRAYAVSP